MENMEIYERSRYVPQEAQKSFNNGKFSGTDINPMWRIKKLTEMFGPAGIGWYYEVVSERAEEHGDVTIAVVDLNLYFRCGGEWSKPIYGTGGNVLLRKGNTSDEGYKMALTDALSVACKALGIGADVYFSADKTKYTAASTPNEVPQDMYFTCADCGAKLVPYKGNSGKYVSIRQHVAASEKKFGRALCLECIAKVNNEIAV